MAEENNETGGQSAKAANATSRSRGAVEASTTGRGIRVAAVSGTLLVLAFITLYLTFGAAGLLTPYEGSPEDFVSTLARIFVVPVLVSYAFLFHRPQLEERFDHLLGELRAKDWWQQTWIWIVFAMGAFTGAGLGYLLDPVEYSQPAELRAAVDRVVGDTIVAVSATTAGSVVVEAGTASPQAQSPTGQDDTEDSTIRAAVSSATRAALVSAVRSRSEHNLPNADATAVGWTELSDRLEGIAAAAAYAAIDAGIETSRQLDLRRAIRHSIDQDDVQVVLQLAPKVSSKSERNTALLAELLTSSCLAFFLFAPRELGRLLKGSSSGPRGPALSGYFGLLSGVLIYLALWFPR